MEQFHPEHAKEPGKCRHGAYAHHLPNYPMRIPERLQEVDQEAFIREYKYDNTKIIVVDFGSKVSDIAVDIVDCTAIVVVNGEQFEFELPDDTEEITTKNGVLTIEG